MNKPHLIVNIVEEVPCLLGLDLHESWHSQYVWYLRFDVGVLLFPSSAQANIFARHARCLKNIPYRIVPLEEVIRSSRK